MRHLPQYFFLAGSCLFVIGTVIQILRDNH